MDRYFFCTIATNERYHEEDFGSRFFCMCLSALNAQNRRYYCEITGQLRPLGRGMKIILDFGQRTAYNFWGDLTSKLTFVDEKGKTIEFNSMIDAANYMSERHWYFLQAYVTYPKNELMEHWLFYKDAASPEKAKEGIMTKEDFRKSYPRKEGKDESKPIEEEGNEQENE